MNEQKAVIRSEDDLVEKMELVKSVLSYDEDTGLFRWSSSIGKWRRGDLAGWNHSRGYTAISIFRFKVYAHRLAVIFMTGSKPVADVDHINGDRKDNRWVNLRCVSRRVNLENRTNTKSNNTSGLLGVHWNSQKSMWQAEIKSFGKKRHIGFFSDKYVAHQEYLRVKREIHEGCTL